MVWCAGIVVGSWRRPVRVRGPTSSLKVRRLPRIISAFWTNTVHGITFFPKTCTKYLSIILLFLAIRILISCRLKRIFNFKFLSNIMVNLNGTSSMDLGTLIFKWSPFCCLSPLVTVSSAVWPGVFKLPAIHFRDKLKLLLCMSYKMNQD